MEQMLWEGKVAGMAVCLKSPLITGIVLFTSLTTPSWQGHMIQVADQQLTSTQFVLFYRNSFNQMPFYYTQSHEVHQLLISAGAFDDGERDVRMC